MLVLSCALIRSARLPRQPGVRRLNVFAMLASSYFAATICGWETVALPLSRAGTSRASIGVVAVGASLTLVVVLVGMGRLLRRATPVGPAGDATPDECWKWGQF